MLDSIFKIIGNFLLIQASIIIFILPFYYMYVHDSLRDTEAEVKLSFNHRIEHFFSSKYANWLFFFCALGEALVWFIIPEFLLILLIFMRIKRKRQLLFYDIYGTIVGTLVAFVIHVPERFFEKLPYIQHNMILQTKIWFNTHGILGLIYQPFSGVPYKVFTHLAPHYHYFFLSFLIFAVIVRVSRYYIIYMFLTGIYPLLHKYVYRNYVRLFIISTLIFSLLLLKVYNSYGPQYHVSDIIIKRITT